MQELAVSLTQLSDLLYSRQEDHAHTHELLRLTQGEMDRLLKEMAKVVPITEWLLDNWGEARLANIPVYHWPELAERIIARIAAGAK
ncbi:hypothetical protein UFOVP62_29 [uncultured Caudovirales phage]|uniref:Uncharacterized protein n=1 Tax=uncultured Caudovirales phage TaxID=2100421 RepID=A0A6J5KUX1_9CAUD|nr:hypothetical protein UFOVP62_29 [uncultured Caudovirales phage]